MALETTPRASSQQGSGLSIATVLCSIDLYSSLFILILLIHYSRCSELITGHCDKTQILNSKNMIFKGRNLSLVNCFVDINGI